MRHRNAAEICVTTSKPPVINARDMNSRALERAASLCYLGLATHVHKKILHTKARSNSGTFMALYIPNSSPMRFNFMRHVKEKYDQS